MLTVQDVRAGYRAREVLRGATLDCAPGELLAVVGPNGCGKTTLLRVISGVLAPRSGRVTIEGTPVEAYNPAALARLVADCQHRSVGRLLHWLNFRYGVAGDSLHLGDPRRQRDSRPGGRCRTGLRHVGKRRRGADLSSRLHERLGVI